MIIVPQNAVAPTTITLTFKSPVFGPDLTTVTAITAGLLRRDGTQTSLTFTIVSATTRELIAQYTFVGGELTTTGAYYLGPLLACLGGQIPSETVALAVVGPFNAIPRLESDAWIMGTVPVQSLGPIKGTWVIIATATTASPYGPCMAVDMRTASLAVTLWSANDGDVADLSDVYVAASGVRIFTLNGAAGQGVPKGDGTFPASANFTTPGFALRLRYSKTLSAWLPR